MSETVSAEASVRLVRVIWLALVVSICIYAVVIFIALRQPPAEPFGAALSKPFIIALHVAALGILLCAFVVPPVLLRDANSSAAPRLAGPHPTRAVGPRTRRALIVRWTFIEWVAVFGLLAAFISRDPRLFLPLGGLAIVSLVLTYPTDSALDQMAMP